VLRCAYTTRVPSGDTLNDSTRFIITWSCTV